MKSIRLILTPTQIKYLKPLLTAARKMHSKNKNERSMIIGCLNICPVNDYLYVDLGLIDTETAASVEKAMSGKALEF